MSHDELVSALRATEGLVDVGQDPPIFQFRSRPFLHFHVHPDGDGVFAHVRFGRGGFEPVWSSTPQERLALLARVMDHVERLDGTRKTHRVRSGRTR
jgi:hypothetical protein